MRILAIGAHSDDMDFFCGGTLARFAATGYVVGICSMTDGRSGGKAESLDELALRRRKEFMESAAVIGAETFWPGYHDSMLMDDRETRLVVVEIIRSFQPDLIVTHPPEDYHPDHVATSRLVMDASFVARSATVKTKTVRLPGVVPILFVDAEAGHGFLPDEYVDVTESWPQKVRMLSAHHSQYDGWINPVSGEPENWLVDRATVLGRFRGLQCGVLHAEAFKFFRAHGRVRAARLLP
jgi:LmbE family N-acetylglucosaminyl deacetylase